MSTTPQVHSSVLPQDVPLSPGRHLRVLMVEDNPDDVMLLNMALENSGYVPASIVVTSEGEFRNELKQPLDLILCDFSLPGFDALRALEILRESGLETPCVIVSGSIGEETAVQTMKQGAADYLMKDRLRRLGSAVGQALDQCRMRAAEKKAEKALVASEAQYRAMAESIPHIVWKSRADGTLEYVNGRAREYGGVSSTEWNWQEFVHPHDLSRVRASWLEDWSGEETQETEFRLRRSDGEYRWHLSRTVMIMDEDGRAGRRFGTCTDIHDQKLAAERLKQDAIVLANVRESIIVVDSQGLVTYWNEGATRLFGWSSEEMVGRPYVSRFPASMREGVGSRIRERLKGGEWSGEYEDIRKDGSRVWIYARSCCVVDAAGGYPKVVGLAHDITENKRAQEDLRLRDRAIQSVSQGILITDATRSKNPITYASPGFERLTGYKQEEILGLNCSFLQGKETDPAAIAAMRAAISKACECNIEILNYRRDGTSFWNSLSISPVRDNGVLTHFVGILTDVSERRKLEDQYRQAQKMEAVGRLAGGVAHDFNNLLTVINGYGDLLLADLESEDPNRGLVEEIREAGERASGLTAQLLSFSRKSEIETRVVGLNEVVEAICKMLRRLIGEDIGLHVDLAPSLGLVRIDPGQVEQILMNLAVNSRDAMAQGGRLSILTRHVEVVADGRRAALGLVPGRYVTLDVADTGCGISEEVQRNIFEPFFTTKGPGQGTGLGLAIVYRIVKSMAGHIEVVSELGVGTTFTVMFPVVNERLEAGAEQLPVYASGGKETVLLVEDDEPVRRLARLSLTSQGYQVLEASCGAEAKEIATVYPGKIHLVVADVVMPDMGGSQLIQALRERRPALPVLYVSGYADQDLNRYGVYENSDDFLQKPFALRVLADKVRRLLDRKS